VNDLSSKRCTAVLLLLLVIASPTAAVQSSTSVPARLAQLLDKSGYKFTKAADNVWIVPFMGKSMGHFPVFVTSVEGLVVTAAVVAKKDSLSLTPEAMQKLLHLAHNLDRVKIGLDDDGDLFVRTEVTARTYDDAELKADFEQVAAAADEIRAAINPYVK
jgi:hypothetical protein